MIGTNRIQIKLQKQRVNKNSSTKVLPTTKTKTNNKPEI